MELVCQEPPPNRRKRVPNDRPGRCEKSEKDRCAANQDEDGEAATIDFGGSEAALSVDDPIGRTDEGRDVVGICLAHLVVANWYIRGVVANGGRRVNQLSSTWSDAKFV
jgi:hypothetical protein